MYSRERAVNDQFEVDAFALSNATHQEEHQVHSDNILDRDDATQVPFTLFRFLKAYSLDDLINMDTPASWSLHSIDVNGCFLHGYADIPARSNLPRPSV
ncbi:hypothetical protein Ae201684P_018055 [Aphanomyces euteiches]|uniref:Uncharacterized protein n=1 Tax=Aphanomyces euteiches TaxID=100861 RepID=A0A6G0X3H7_9STRA|nr:hypothetical protein Ae201684_008889 [Aphanomyces euteiches]KAH9054333.1 hypothetical protein Ae201684P_018055 [Aphanomyces euteiches]